MPRYLITLLIALMLSSGGFAQDSEPTAEAEAAADAAAEDGSEAAAEEDDVLADDADLDENTYEENDDDFIPTEEIPVDEPIAFPSNI
jgi:hypothetical protein